MRKIVLGMAPGMEILDEGQFGKRIPVQCHICKKRNGRPAVFDLIDGFTPQVLTQHLNSYQHRQGVASLSQKSSGPSSSSASSANSPDKSQSSSQPDDLRDPNAPGDSGGDDAGEESQKVVSHRCPAWCSSFAPAEHKLGQVAETLKTYAKLSGRTTIAHLEKNCLGETLLHDYQFGSNRDEVTIRHRSCTGTVQVTIPSIPADGQPPDHVVCGKCMSLGNDRHVLRTLCRFAQKYYGAFLLRTRLFFPDKVEEELRKIKEVDFYRIGWKTDLDNMMDMSLEELWRAVRSGFYCLPQLRQPAALKDFVATVVKPCMEINPCTWNADVAMNSQKMAERLQNRTLSTVADVELKAACQIANGGLRSNPVFQGLVCALLEITDRKSRGLTTMRNLQLSDTEMDLISEAGISLSLSSGNKKLLKEFGLKFKGVQSNLAKLLSMGLPDPFLSILSDEVLNQNILLVDSLCQRHQDAPRRRLSLAFDKTYCLKSLDVIRGRLGKCWVGSAFEMFAEEQQPGRTGYIPLLDASDEDHEGQEDQGDGVVDGGRVHKADEILEIVIWDPCSTIPGRPRYPVATIPMRYECSGLEMLQVIGQVLEKASNVAHIAARSYGDVFNFFPQC